VDDKLLNEKYVLLLKRGAKSGEKCFTANVCHVREDMRCEMRGTKYTFE
jgi:hypothetical protein